MLRAEKQPLIGLALLAIVGAMTLVFGVRQLSADVVQGQYSLEANVALTSVALNTNFTMQVRATHGFAPQPCTDGLTNGIDDDLDGFNDNPEELLLGLPLNDNDVDSDQDGLDGPNDPPGGNTTDQDELPPGCYQGVQFNIDYDETMVTIGTIAVGGSVPPNASTCENNNDGDRLLLTCVDTTNPRVTFSGTYFNVQMQCTVPGTANFTMTTGVQPTFIAAGTFQFPMHLHNDSIQCGSTPTPTNTTVPSSPTPTNTLVPTSTNTTVPTSTNTTVPTSTNTSVPTATNTTVPTATNTTVPTATNTSVATATNTSVATATNTSVPTATNTNVPTATNTTVPTATNTLVPTATNTTAPTATNTLVPTATNTSVPTATNTVGPSPTNTTVPTATNTSVPTATNTTVPTATNTAVPTATNTPVPTATNTPVPTATNTAVPPSATPTRTNTPVPTATTPTGCFGDLNRDGKVTGKDVSIVARNMIHENDPRADVDHDRDVDLVDLKLVIAAMHAKAC